MKQLRKLIMAALAVLSALVIATPAFAAGTGTITITPPANTLEEAKNVYKVYKVFDADGNGTSISYKLVEGKTEAPDGFAVDKAGNVSYTGTGTDELTATDIAAIADYVTDDDPVRTVTATGGDDVVVEDLPNGFYYITTSTGSVVTIDTTNPNATVIDKNTVPTVDKKITGASSLDEDGKKALAQVGTTVSYEATITVGKGAVGYVFHDLMSAGLDYNKDAAVAGVPAGQYEIKATPAKGDTITITFVDGIKEGTKITITYSATVTSDALSADPAKNTATISYGDENGSNTTPPSSTEVYNAKFTVTKQDGERKPLPNAGFVIANAQGKYYKLTNGVVSWVDAIGDATEYTSDATGAVPAFTGLANGKYTLIEKTVPSGYNKAADSYFTIEEHDYATTNLEQTSTVTNNAGTVLPSTGGIGTTIFYIVGGALLIGGIVLFVTKRRVASMEK